MANDDDDDDADIDTDEPQPVYDDDEPEGGIFRWMSAVVVLLAVAGFFGLAWYAYKNGGDTVDDKDVELIKADKTPVKEAPANPGGMQIPNQDKTVYGLISGKNEKPVVERILPSPEEPLPRGDTETWMSESVKNKNGGETAAPPAGGADIIAPPPAKTASAAPAPAPAPAAPREQFNPGKLRTEHADGTPMVASATPPPPASAPAPKPAPAAPASTVAPTPPAPPPAPAKAAAPAPKTPAAESDNADEEESKPAASASPPPPASGTRVQLGAYKSQGEADSNWAKIARNFSDELKNKQHYVVRADLGGKGVYYRLQVGPFASSKDAEEFCIDFVSAGQGCIPAKGK